MLHNDVMKWYEPLNILDEMDVESEYSLSYEQKAFLCGLIKQERPKKILEIGTCFGATAVTVLQSINLLHLDAELYSVDIAEKIGDHPIGYQAINYNKIHKQNWKLYTKGVVADFIRDIGNGIDFCILDAAHFLPGEVLDFITILPYLNSNAVVVIHDTILQVNDPFNFATATLLSCVVADKFLVYKDGGQIDNIAAFRINNDTLKYIDNLILSLSLPGRFLDEFTKESYRKSLQTSYPAETCSLFLKMLDIGGKSGEKLSINGSVPDFLTKLLSLINKNADKINAVALRGAGIKGKEIALLLNHSGYNHINKKVFFVDASVTDEQEHEFMGFPLKSVNTLVSEAIDYVGITVSSNNTQAYEEIYNDLLMKGFLTNQIF